MRVRAHFNFYLDFMLPRISGTERIGVHTTIDECEAWISTWGEAEPLFPSDVDQTLSTFQIELTPPARPEISIQRDSKSRILDRISVILEWNQDSPPVADRSYTDSFLERAVLLANAILEHIRVSCKLVDIKKIRRAWDHVKSEIEVTAPHTQAWFDADSNQGLPVFMGLNSILSTEGIRIGPVPSTTVAQLTTTLTGTGPPPLYLSLLMDAEEALLSLSVREATILIASGCETRALLFGRSRLSKSKLSAIGSTPSTSFATKYYELLPLKACGRSFKTENASSFSLINQAYSERNKLMHTGTFSSAFQKEPELMKLRTATEWLASARAAVDWISGL